MVSRQCDELDATAVEQRTVMDQERLYRLLPKIRKGRVNLTTSAGMENLDLPPDSRGCCVQLRCDEFSIRTGRIDKRGKSTSLRQKLTHDRKPLGHKHRVHVIDARDIAARPV